MTRSGSILVWCLVLLSLAAVVSQVGIQKWRSYSSGLQILHEQQQAREWALGAGLLEPGEEIHYQGWVIRHESNGLWFARHQSGSGWWIRRRGDLIVEEGALNSSEQGLAP